MIRESWIVFRRQLRMSLRNPVWLLVGVLQPVLYLILFAPLLKPLIAQFGADDAYRFIVPGLVVQLSLFGAFLAGFGLLAEWRDGVVEAERVTPAARTALLVGRLGRDLLQLLVQALFLVGLGYALGMRAPVHGVIVGIGLAMLIGGACATASNALALTTRDEDKLAPVINLLSMPVLLLSGILLPLTLGPTWLRTLGEFLPGSHVVNAVRASFEGAYASGRFLSGALWTMGLFVLALWWGTRAFRRENV
ncbi:ABC transporter permease [Polymorphospora rubra]|uniref:ABC transporter permease n=1 Tax=Polymorphospora rubra TaxID=338584 RepID=UPI00340A46D9